MRALRNLPFLTTVAIFLLAYAICVAQFPNMLSTRVIGNLLTDNAFLGIAAVGMTFVILSGGIDLSVGSVIAFTSVFVAVLVGQLGVHPLVAFGLILAIAALFGAWMGMMIHFLNIPPFVATLAGMFLRARPFSSRRNPYRSPTPFSTRCRGFISGFPAAAGCHSSPC